MIVSKNVLQFSLGAFLVSILLFLPLATSAATVKGGETYSLREGNLISDNLYVGAGEVSVVGDVVGDLYAIGGSVTVSGNISDDTVIGGGDVSVLQNVGGDLRIAGGDILVTANVRGDLVVLGGNVRVLSDARVGKDLVILGGRVVLEGTVAGTVSVISGEIFVDGEILGDASLGGETITIGDNAVLNGNLTYKGKNESVMEISESAVILGEVVFKEGKGIDGKGIRGAILAFLGLFLLIKIISYIIIAILAAMLFNKFSTRAVRAFVDSPGKELIRGFSVLILIPVVIFLSFISVFGAIIGVLGIFAYATLILLSTAYSGMILGAFLQKLILKSDEVIVTWKNASLGVVALSALVLIPIVGWLIGLFFFLVSLGVISGEIYQSFWVGRK